MAVTYADLSRVELLKHLQWLEDSDKIFGETDSTKLAKMACAAALKMRTDEEEAIQRDDKGLQG